MESTNSAAGRLPLLAGLCWIGSLAAAVAFPWLFPVLVLVILFPLVLAIPRLDHTRLRLALAVGLTTLAAAGVIAISNDDGGLIDDIDDEIELLVIAGGLVTLGLGIGLTIRRSNDAHRRATLDALESRRRIVTAADAARAGIERDLHDGAQQQLVALGMHLGRLTAIAERDAPDLAPELTEASRALRDATEQLRHLSHGIYPPLLEARGLAEALAATARRAGNDVTVDVDLTERPAPTVETALYFCATEALTNADKHAPGATVHINGRTDADHVHLSITDDGPGFETEGSATDTPASRGLTNMADRLAVIGGRLRLDSHPGRGTTLSLHAPTRQPADGAAPAGRP